MNLRNLHAGMLDRLVEVYQVTDGAVNSFNEPEKTESLVYKGYAAKVDIAGTGDDEKDVQDSMLIASTAVGWVIRWTATAIRPKMWLMWNGQRYELTKMPVELGRKDFMMLATELKDNV